MIELVKNKKLIKKIQKNKKHSFLVKNSKTNVLNEWVKLINSINA